MKKLAILFLIIAVASMALLACNDPPDPIDPNQGNNNTDDNFWTSGFTKDRATPTEMFNDLIGCAMQSMKLASSDVVPSQTYKIALNCSINIDYNGVKSRLVIKSNYDYRKPEDSVMTLEVFSIGDNQLQIGVYLYQNSGVTNLYIHLEDNKIRIPLNDISLAKMFPIQMRFDAESSTLVASGFLLFMNVLDDIDYEYKTVNNYSERHYRFYVDVAHSLSKLASMSPEWQEIMGMSDSEINFVLRNILGVDSSDIQNGNIPDTAIKVEFTTQGGHPEYFGAGKLTKLKLDVDVQSMQTGDTVFGKDFNIVVDATQIRISNSVVSDIPNETAFADYVNYDNRQFRIFTVMQYDSDTEASDIILDFIFDAANADNTCFALTATGQQSKEQLCSIYYKDQYIYANWIDGETEKNLEGHFNFNKFIEMVSEEAKNSPNISFLSLLSYITGSLRLQNCNAISYHFIPEFFQDLAGIDDDKLLVIFEECSDEDVAAMLASSGIAISSFNSNFTLSLNYGEKIIEQISVIIFPDILNNLSK